MGYSLNYPDYDSHEFKEYINESQNLNTCENLKDFLRPKLRNLYLENKFIYYILKYKQYSEIYNDELDKNYKFESLVKKLESEKDNKNYNIANDLIKGFENLNEIHYLKGIFEDVDSIIPKTGFKNEMLPELINIINEFTLDDYDYTFYNILEEILYWDIYHSDNIYRNVITPAEINELMSKLIYSVSDMKKTYYIFDGFAGFGCSLNSVHNHLQNYKNVYISGEKNEQISEIGKLFNNLLSDDRNHIYNRDTLTLDNRFNNSMDRIISQVPFNPKEKLTVEQKEALESRGIELSTFNLSEWIYVLSLLSYLKNDGFMVVAIPYGSLSKIKDKQYREKIINENVLDGVIKLPPKISRLTNTSISILIFKKDRKQNEKVFFIDASEWYEPKKRYNKLTNEYINRIVSEYSDKKDSKYCSNISIDTIKDNDFNLNFNSYINKLDIEHIDLSEILNERKEIMEDLTYLDDIINNFNSKYYSK